jgi:putative protease
MNNTTQPEILAPVGDWEMLSAAVHNGADAVYIGMPGFNARGRAPTLTEKDLKEMIAFCHLYGVRVCLAFNVLIFENEWLEVTDLLLRILPLKPDALIVQDIGLIRFIKKIAPDQVVHASTQMTISNAEAIALTSELGIKRYVLARELSLDEIGKIRTATDKELEVFVHGALCVSYSGQCLTSERIGGRSANRGQCAQSCRLPYALIVDGVEEDLKTRSYVVSPKDLCGLEEVDALKALGVDSFKIEGRLKSAQYVAATTDAYRKKLIGNTTASSDLGKMYSRGFFSGWLHGVDHQKLVDGRYSHHKGVAIGIVKEVIPGRKGGVLITGELLPADGVVFVNFSENREVAGPVFEVSRQKTGENFITFANDFDLTRVKVGDEVFVNSSPQLERQYTHSYSDKARKKKIPITLTVEGAVGSALVVGARDVEGHTVEASSSDILVAAHKAPLTKESLAAELGALYETPYVLVDLNVHLSDAVFLHQRALKVLRRAVVEALDKKRKDRAPLVLQTRDSMTHWIESEKHRHTAHASAVTPELHVLIRDLSQLAALEKLAIGTVYFDFEFGKEYREALLQCRKLGFKGGIATTRILKPGELGHLSQIKHLKPDSVLVRNIGALQHLRDLQVPLIGDFSLNAANSLSTGWYLDHGFDRICPSYDLNRDQLLDLVTAIGGQNLEITVHQYMPEFHMEHCVFAAFLSSGSSFRDCGRPCEKHRVELRAPDGSIHPLKADAECRNTMFHGVPQSAARLVPKLREGGVANFRLEALYETPQELRAKVETYLELLSGHCAPDQLFEKLRIAEKYGVSEGQLINVRGYVDRKKSPVAAQSI